ncbi:MAG: Hsp70 family protein [Anaerolineales bacterium]|nr:Hsp70 family protein [Anaerolineales bacterium]
MYVGLDFGTSNSSIALYQDGKIRLFELDPGSINPRMLRSFIFINRAQEHFTGSEAVRQYQTLETGRPVFWEMRHLGEVQMVVGGGGGPIIYWDDLFAQVDTAANGRLIQSIKTGLRNPAYKGTDVLGQYYQVEELIGIILRDLRAKCAHATGEEPTGVVLGRPVKFSDEEEVDARAQAKIEAAARLAGFEEVHFEYEPIAAAYVFHQQTAERQPILVFDFGGGTLDFTVMEVGGNTPPKVLSTNGVLLGGDDLDRAIMQPLKRFFGEGASLRNRMPLPGHLMGMLDSWQTMVLLSRPEYKSILRDARRGSDPDSIQRLENLVNKNLGFSLFQEIERAKIKLSREATAWINMEKEGLSLRDLITRPQFERLITHEVEQVDAALDETLHLSGLRADQIQAVLRTGGSSEIPAFIRLLGDKFGHDRLRELSPFETIVGGLAIRAGEFA